MTGVDVHVGERVILLSELGSILEGMRTLEIVYPLRGCRVLGVVIGIFQDIGDRRRV